MSEAAGLSVSNLDRDKLVAAIREVFSSGIQIDRDAAIREVSHALGFRRTGAKIAAAVESALVAAVKRGVIQNDRGILSINCRSIGDYGRDQLIETLIASIGGAWWEREDAIRASARRLGFRRTGSAIREVFKSAITGAIRRGVLEYDGQLVRRKR